jgi:hypothetical protein
MEKYGLIKSEWGSRLGQSVKLYYLIAQNIGIRVDQDGIKIKFTKKDKAENIVFSGKKNRRAQSLIIRPIGSTEFFDPLQKDQLI